MPLISQNPNRQAGLVKASASADPPAPVVTQKIASPEYKGVAVDLRWLNRGDLLTHVSGSSWVVDYYSQVLDTDSNLSGQQLTVDGAYQQYKKISKLELKVQSPLSTSQTDDTKGMNLEGVSIVYPFMIPNEGDMFVADIGEGKKGVFRVTNTVKKSIFKQACYEIEYSLDTDQADKLEDLEDKTVSTVVYHQDFVALGKNPMLLTSQHDALMQVGEIYQSLCAQYFQRFFSNEYKTLMVPAQEQTTYDAFLVNHVLKQFTTEESEEIRFIRQLSLGGDQVVKCHNFWTVLAERNPVYLKTAFQKAGKVSSRIFNDMPLVNSIRYTGIACVLYPLDAQLLIEGVYRNSESPIIATPIENVEPPLGGLYKMVEAINLAQVNGEAEGTVKPVAVDEFYVLSEAFYRKQDTMSTLEDVVWQYIERKPVDVQQLVATAELWNTWGRLEQFYYIPILMQMMRSVLRGE